MRNLTRFSLTVLTCICSLQLCTANAVSSASLRPVQGKTMVYESYISNEGCEKQTSTSRSFTGGSFGPISGYAGDNNPISSGKPLSLSCKEGYAMVNMTSQTSGIIASVGLGGGQINNNGTAMCCPIKHRWAPPQTAA